MESDWAEYYCRDRQFVRVVEVAQRSGGDVKWKYYRGLGLVLGEKPLDGISCLEPLVTHGEFGLAASHLSLIAHLSCETVDREATAQLEWRVEAAEAGERALAYATSALMHAGQHDKARALLDRLMRLNPSSVLGLVLSGWLELAEKPNNLRTAARLFRTALSHFEAKARCSALPSDWNMNKTNQGQDVNEATNQTLRQLLERQTCCDAKTRQDKGNLDAVLGEVVTLSPADAIAKLNQLIVRYPKCAPPLSEKMRLQLSTKDWTQALDTAARILSLEANNLSALELKALHLVAVEGNYAEGMVALRRLGTQLEAQRGNLVAAAQLFSRISGCNAAILGETHRLAEKCSAAKPDSAEALLELATQSRLVGRFSEAAHLFKTVTKIDGTSTAALTGLTAVQLAQSGITDQVRQQVEFLSEVAGSEQSAELLLLRAQCERDLSLLDTAVSSLFTAASQHGYGPQHLRQLNPLLLMDIVLLYPQNTEGMKKRISVLRQVVDVCPGLIGAVLALAQAQAATGDYSAATLTAKQLLSQVDSTNTDAHLVLAQIHLAQEEYEEANASLELGLSYNLQVRDRPLYHVLLGAVQHHHDDAEACVQSMRTALSLNTGEHKLSINELSTLYLELVASLTETGKTEEAMQALQEANEALQGTEQEGRLAIARGELAAVRGDYTAALSLLADTGPDHPYYVQARKKMGEIYLNKLKDGRAFADCYKQLVSTKPSTENLILLGDAYMAIQEPELAVETYEKAMRSSSSDPKLSARLGRVLVKTHQYGKAIKCFKDAGGEGSLELAQLLMRLGQLESAEKTLSDVPLAQKAFVLAKIKEKAGDVTGAMRVMKEAREGLGASEVAMNGKMCAQLAEYASAVREYDVAITYYKRALQCRPSDPHLEITLAKLYMQVNDWSSCQSVCSSLLNRDPDNEPALLMLADLAYRRTDFEDAAAHFSALLTRHPTYWVALARLIEVKRRTAQLDDAKPYLEAATQAASMDPGLSYCTGLFDWYSGNVNSALHHFNSARGDSEWGQQALHNMVELCLATEDDNSVATATRLLGQMRPHSADEQSNVRLLHNLILLSSKDKQDVELAVNDLTNLASQENLRVGATLGLATGYILQKQGARARNVLKRVAKAVWLVEEAEYLERCWLLLADLQVQAGKHEPGMELLRRVLKHNQSCHRAYQLAALIADKDQKYVEACTQYKQAWKLSGENDPALGYKLAFNQVKAKRYADAISTCQAVLALNPEYPRIRKEILDKAISHLRS